CQIRLLVKVLKSGVSVFLEYRNSFIPTEQAKNVASTLEKLLTDVLSTPDLAVKDVKYLSERNKQQIEKWNSKPLVNIERTIHDMIIENVEKMPQEEAVCAWDGSLTYNELDVHASRLATHLIKLAVGPEVIVPLCFDKSKWNVVAVLATLYAGAAFLPLDPAYPRSRIQHLVDSTNARTVLCSRAHIDLLMGVAENVIPVDHDSMDALPVLEERPQSQATSHNAAYIIPTSGTTGQPKLTLIEHGNFCTGAAGHIPGMYMSETHPLRALQFAAHSFDASVTEILSPLMAGGTTCIPDEHTRLNEIVKVINDMRATYAQLTPTFVRFLEPSMVPTLQTIVLMGEPMSQANLDTWSKINLINGYGPSECSVASVVSRPLTSSSDPRNIGYPISCRAWVVNPEDYHELLPVGCVGELLIEGHLAGRGYLNDQEKTAQVFVEAVDWAADRPFRGYLTGDLVFQNIDGTLNIVGRKDSQVVSQGQDRSFAFIAHKYTRNTMDSASSCPRLSIISTCTP
ncbi:AMP-binding-domain-containing protein, partial [Sporormia fimetaria CBS 119925]